MPPIKEINDGIKEAVANIVSSRTPGYNLQETDYAIALALEFPKIMNQKHVCPKIKYGGCFIDQSQIARINNSFKSPYKYSKLGDLLILVRKHSGKKARFNAALVQMKKSTHNSVDIKDPHELASLRLLKQWPKFSLLSTGNQYDIYPKTVSQGALYCIIKQQQQKKECQFYMAEPKLQMTVDSQMTLARFIRDAMNWQTGRAISIEADSGSDEWSKLIWDLIRQTERTAVYRNGINYYSPTSLSNGFLHLLLERQKIDLSTPTNNVNQGADGCAGISILFIDIDEGVMKHP